MSGRELDANEVARLLALPESHPDRIRALEDPELASLAQSLAAFEAPQGADARALEQARAALRERLAGTLGPVRSTRPRGAALRRTGFSAMLARPATRAVLAAASLVVVAGLAWWSLDRSRAPQPVRGTDDSSMFRLLATQRVDGRLLLSWTADPGADRYRVRFLGPDLGEVAHADAGSSTRMVVRPDALPAGLAPGARLAIEVVAMRGDSVVGTTPARSIQLP